MSRTRKNKKSKKNLKNNVRRSLKQKGGDMEKIKIFIENFVNIIKPDNGEQKILNRDDVLLCLLYLNDIGVKIYNTNYNATVVLDTEKLNLDQFEKYTSPLSNILHYTLQTLLPDNEKIKNLILNEVLIKRRKNEKDHLFCEEKYYPMYKMYKYNLSNEDMKKIYPENYVSNLNILPKKIINLDNTIFNIYLKKKINQCPKQQGTYYNMQLQLLGESLKPLHSKKINSTERTTYFHNKNLSFLPTKCHVFSKDFKYNLKYVNPINIKYIIGPCAFYEFEYDNRRFYIFGETHNKLSLENINCSSDMKPENTVLFATLIKSLAKYYQSRNINRTIDLFIENTPTKLKEGLSKNLYIPPNYITNSESLSSIICELYNFIDIDTKYNDNDILKRNLRIQNIDIRYFYVNFFDPNILEQFTKTTNLKELKDKIKEIILKSPTIEKQLINIKDDEIKKIIIETILQEIDDIDFNMFGLPKSIDLGIQSVLLKINKLILGVYFTSVMDIYAIGRMFRKFDIEDNEITPFFKGTASDNFYYCGNAHAKKLKTVIDNIMKVYPEKIKLNINVIDNCPSLISQTLRTIPFSSKIMPSYSCLKLDISQTGMIPNESSTNTNVVIEMPSNNGSANNSRKSNTFV